MAIVTVDVGGSGVRAARFADGLLAQRSQRRIAPQSSASQLSVVLCEVIGELDPDEHDTAVGIAFPGFLDAQGHVARGIYVSGMVGMDLRSEIAAAMPGRPVAVLPDLAAAALAESRACAEADRLLCVGIGSGANAALVVSGEVVDLAGGALGDAGHLIVEPDGPACRCGGRGCLEARCSGWALARDGTAHGFADAAAVTAAARSGEQVAVELLAHAGEALGRAIAGWAAMTFPDAVAVVGGVSRADDLLLGPARAELARVGQPQLTAELPVRVGSCGADAALIGAALAASELSGWGTAPAPAGSTA